MRTSVEADLCFRVEDADGQRIDGHLTGSGQVLTLRIDDPGAFAGAGDAAAVRYVADELAARRLEVRVTDGRSTLVRLGDVRAPWWQRRLTRSRHLRVGSLRGLWTAAQARAQGREPVLPSLLSAPPPTLSPILPTFGARPRHVAGTHDPARAGSPRLVLVPDLAGPETRRTIYSLAGDCGDSFLIGSAEDCHIRLPGLAPHHCVVVHDDDDEFVAEALDGEVRVHGARVQQGLLRTGTRLELGEHCLAFAREEYADHGRPYGGRIGGELGHQRPQPERLRLIRGEG